VWLTRALVDRIQEAQRQRYGGNSGVLNNNAIESALARAQRKTVCGDTSFFDCASAYAFGLARNHGYRDANERTAYISAITFLRLNGWTVNSEPLAVLQFMVAVAVGKIAEPAMAEWFESRAREL
jgi:death on curing protein